MLTLFHFVTFCVDIGFYICLDVFLGSVHIRRQWEDPEVDMQHLNITKDDALFVITSAGDSVYPFQSPFPSFLCARATHANRPCLSLCAFRCASLLDIRTAPPDPLCRHEPLSGGVYIFDFRLYLGLLMAWFAFSRDIF